MAPANDAWAANKTMMTFQMMCRAIRARNESLLMLTKFLSRLLPGLLCLLSLDATAWTVSMPNGRYTESVEDMRVKIPGGYMRLQREFDGKQWYINRHWSSLNFEFDDTVVFAVSNSDSTGTQQTSRAMPPPRPPEPPEVFGGTVLPGVANPLPGTFKTGPLYAISRNGAWFDVDATFRSFKLNGHGRYVLTPQFENGVPPAPGPGRTFGGIFADSTGSSLERQMVMPYFVTGFRWEERDGSWIEYDRLGRIMRYGNRRGLIASMVYSSGTLVAVADRNGRQVMTFHYTGGRLTEVYDNPEAGDPLPQRVVHYQYNGDGSISQVTDVRGFITGYEYDSKKRLNKVIDAAQRERTINWGPANKVESVHEMTGAQTDYEYSYDSVAKQHFIKVKHPELPADGSGSTTLPRRIEGLTYDKNGIFVRMEVNGRVVLEMSKDQRTQNFLDEQGRVTSQTFDEFDNITSITYPDGARRSWTYDPALLKLTQETDENGVTHVYAYDELGARLQSTRAAGLPEQKVTTYVPDDKGRPTSATRAATVAANGVAVPAVTVGYEYDANDNVTLVRNGEGQATQYGYNRMGQVTTVTEPSGKVWRYGYDAAGNPVSEETPNGHVTSYEYDGLGDPITLTDARQKSSHYQYDDVNNVTRFIDPYGNAQRWQYNGAGLLHAQSDAENRTSTYRYDSDLRQTRITDPKGNVTSLSYASLDDPALSGMLPTEVSFPTYTKQYRYDARGRVAQETDLLGPEGLVSSNVYDKVGRPKAITDANGKTRYFSYDGHGRLLRFTDSLGKTIELTWDNRDNLIQVKDQRGKLLRYTFDKADRVVAESRPLGQQRSFTYTIDGNLDEETAPDGSRLKYGYDNASRLMHLSLFPAGATTAAKVYDFTYDAANNLTGWSDGTQSSVLTYDDNNRVLTETVNYGGGVQLSYGYTYSAAGLKKTLTWPDSTVITYQHDGNGVLEQVTIPGEGSLTASDWKWMAPQKITLPGGTTQELTLDGLLNLTSLTVKNPAQQTVTELANTYGKVNEVKQKTVDNLSVSFTYDDENRVTKAEEGGVFGATETYTLDAAGNRVATSAVSGAWDYDDNGRLTRKGDTNYEYDDNGNLTRKTVGTSGAPGTITQFRYDGMNRLVEVRDGADTVIATYGYDPFDNRLWKEVGGVRTLFLYSEEGLLAEADATGAITTQYGWAPDGRWGTDPLFIKTRFGGNTQPAFAYYHNDQIGTPQRATDKDGNLVWQADYATFGRASLSAGTTLTSNLRLAGQYLDSETGLHYNTRRYYDPETGRYLSEDPLGINGGWNLYSYAGADPINQIDPTGEWIWVAIRVAVAAYDFYDTYKTIKDGNGCIDGMRLLMDRIPLCRLRWLEKLKKLCDNPCECMGKLQALAGLAAAGADAVGGGLNSFTPETMVHVRPEGADAAQAQSGKATLKPISQLKVGDEVLAFSEWKGKGDTAKADARLSYEKVTDIFTSNREQRLVHITLDSGETLTATEGHPFLTTEGWRDAILLKKGGKLLLKGSYGEQRLAKVSRISAEVRLQSVFNLEVKNAHTFYVTADGVLAHNARAKRPGIYCFMDRSGKPYIGRSVDVPRRLAEHRRSGKLDTDYPVNMWDIPGGADALARAENDAFERAGGLGALANKIRPSRASRR